MQTINYEKGLVSCIVPCYNSEKYLGDCLESIKNQTYKNLELIFTDDGSTDNTLKELEDFKKEFEHEIFAVHIARHESNRGICAAINTGLPYVHGEFITWFDSDDILAETCIERKVDFLKKNREFECVMAQAEIFADNKLDNVIGMLGNEPKIGNNFENYLLQYCATSSGLNMVYTNALFKVLPRDGLREDATEQNWYLMLLIAAKYKIGYIDDIIYHYRLRNDSSSYKKPLRTGVRYKAYWDQVDRIRFYGINDSGLEFIDKCRCFDLQVENSIVNRFRTLDKEQMDNDSAYVHKIINMFVNKGNIRERSKGRKIYLWGCSELQVSLRQVLSQYIDIEGFIKSDYEDKKRGAICGKDIDPKKMYIIITLERHQQIVDLLNEKGFVAGLDYYYPKKNIYEVVSKKDYSF